MPVGLWRIFGCPINEEKQWGYLLQYLSSVLSSVPSSVDSCPNMVYTTHETVQLLMVVSWRWTLWLSLIYAGIIFLVILFLIPETCTKALLEAKARKLRQETGNPDVYATHEKPNQWFINYTRSVYLDHGECSLNLSFFYSRFMSPFFMEFFTSSSSHSL